MAFSVLLSVYKNESAENLEQSFNSLVTQTLFPSEIVVVKDGPLTNELETVVNFYEDKFGGLFKIIGITENVGLANALQIGLQNCSHDLVARMDSDDICLPYRFERQIGHMEVDESIHVLGSRIEEFDERGRIVAIRNVPLEHGKIKVAAKYRNPMNHMTICFRKHAVMSVGGYTRSKDEDYLLWVKMLKHGYKFMNIPDVLVRARAGIQMIRRRGGWGYLKGEVKLQRDFVKLNFISELEFVRNVVFRSLVRLMPLKLRVVVYRRILRKKPLITEGLPWR